MLNYGWKPEWLQSAWCCNDRQLNHVKSWFYGVQSGRQFGSQYLKVFGKKLDRKFISTVHRTWRIKSILRPFTLVQREGQHLLPCSLCLKSLLSTTCGVGQLRSSISCRHHKSCKPSRLSVLKKHIFYLILSSFQPRDLSLDVEEIDWAARVPNSSKFSQEMMELRKESLMKWIRLYSSRYSCYIAHPEPTFIFPPAIVQTCSSSQFYPTEVDGHQLACSETHMADSQRWQELANAGMLHGAHAMCDKIWQGVCGQRNKE